MLSGESNGQRKNVDASRTKRNDNDNKNTIQEKNRNNKTDTKTTQVTPQALLPKQTRQAYLAQNMEIIKATSTERCKSITEMYGNAMKPKHSDHIRLIGQNIGCLGVRSFGNQKQEQGKNWLIQNNVDICCRQEIVISLHMLKHQERIQERMKDYRWSKTRMSTANNKHESIDKLQFGGTVTMAVNEVAARVHASGADERGLGRWTWLLFEGHNNYKTRIISAYVPCKPATKNDATVYQQQSRYLTSQSITTCPRKIMIEELTDQIQTWSKKRENIVLFVDCNENLHKKGQL